MEGERELLDCINGIETMAQKLRQVGNLPPISTIKPNGTLSTMQNMKWHVIKLALENIDEADNKTGLSKKLLRPVYSPNYSQFEMFGVDKIMLRWIDGLINSKEAKQAIRLCK